MSVTAENRFELPSFLQEAVKETSESAGGEQFSGNERFQSERMRERANGQRAVGKLQKTDFG